jgi:hypothetical protein
MRNSLQRSEIIAEVWIEWTGSSGRAMVDGHTVIERMSSHLLFDAKAFVTPVVVLSDDDAHSLRYIGVASLPRPERCVLPSKHDLAIG